MSIQELEKTSGDWCVHCAPGKGCKIYETRPKCCSVFMCNWLIEPSLADHFRPDRCKVVLAPSSELVIGALCDPADPWAWRREPIYSLLKNRVRNAGAKPLIIIVRAGWRAWMLHRDEEVDLGQVNPLADVSFEPGPNGTIKAVIGAPVVFSSQQASP
jgi:hypothetical protein